MPVKPSMIIWPNRGRCSVEYTSIAALTGIEYYFGMLQYTALWSGLQFITTYGDDVMLVWENAVILHASYLHRAVEGDSGERKSVCTIPGKF